MPDELETHRLFRIYVKLLSLPKDYVGKLGKLLGISVCKVNKTIEQSMEAFKLRNDKIHRL